MDELRRQIERLSREIAGLQRFIAEIRQRLASFPVRWGGGGGSGSSVMIVTLVEDGDGADGDEENPPSYTYDVYRRPTGIGDDPIATGVSPVAIRRVVGTFYPATIGIGQFENGEFKLAWCNEDVRTGVCES